MSAYTYTFTVFTPTYNRANTLHRAYESLRAQTFTDFEWLVVDDGSNDCTHELIQKWRQAASFPVRYIYQENSGKNAATNRGVEAAQGELFLFLDSDDACMPVALERYKFHWDAIPAEKKSQFSAVSALVKDGEGRLVGSRFPFDPTDSDSLEIRYKYKVLGEKRGFQRTDVLREHPMPVFGQEKVAAESLVWNRIALKYKTRYVNEVLMIYYQHPDGLSADRFLARALNPQGARRYYWELVRTGYPFSRTALLKAYANYVRFSIHGGVSLREQLQQAPSSLSCLAAWPVGYAVYLRDRLALRAVPASQQETGI